MRINHNIPALNTLNQLEKANNKTAKAMERLSSGLRINSAADDAAGLAIANKMDAQIKGLRQANRNTMDGISLMQTAEGALNEVHAILQRMRELAVQASNGTYSPEDQDKIQQEINELTSEINRIGQTTEFNTKPLLSGKGEKLPFFGEAIKASEENGETVVTLPLPESLTDEELDELLGKKITLQPKEVEIEITQDMIDKVKAETNVNLRGQVLADQMKALIEAKGGFKVETAGGQVKVQYPTGTPVKEAFMQNGGIDRGTTITLQIGANANQTVDIVLGEVTADSLGLTGLGGEPGFSKTPNATDGKTNDKTRAAVSLLTQEDAQNAIVVFDKAIEKVSEQRSLMGAAQNRLEHTVNNLATSEENLTASMSRIQDADMAQEMATFTQQNVLTQAANAMLAQANQIPQQVLQLLQR